MIAVIGASGFIGRNIQDYIKSAGIVDPNDTVMVFFNNEQFIDPIFRKVSFAEFASSHEYADRIETLILVCGNSKRNIEAGRFNEYLSADYQYLLSLVGIYDANIIMLSSSAVYDGYSGEVKEDFMIRPDSLYGIGKYTGELAANYCCSKMHNKKLIIYRLMYAYGKYERETRLMPNLAKNTEGGVLELSGYNNLINPVSAEFIAEILSKTAVGIDRFPHKEIINLSSSDNYSILDIVNFISGFKKINFRLVSEEPVLGYWNSTSKLKEYLDILKVEDEIVPDKILSYFSGRFYSDKHRIS